MPVLGAIPRHDELSVPSRHLGLVTAVEHGGAARAAVAAMTALDRPPRRPGRRGGAGRLARPGAAVDARGCRRANASRADPVVAMAAGRAFSFGYAEHTELLRAAGAQVVEFDPLGQGLPAQTAALVLPGGFPEQYLTELAANAELRAQIRRTGAAGAPVQAECGGLAYLMTDLDGHPMCGVLPGSARFTPRLTLGYRDAVAVADSSLYRAGERVVGHEFHRTTVEFTGAGEPAWVFRRAGGRAGARRCDQRRGARVVPAHPCRRPAALGRSVCQRTRPQSLKSPGDRERLPRRPSTGRQEGRRDRRRDGRAAAGAAADRPPVPTST